jgi:hypothetical protein
VLNKPLEKISSWSRVHLLQLWVGLFILVGIGVYFTPLSTYEGVQILLMVTLVLITWRYAVSAQQQAEASKRMAEEMKLTREMQTAPSIIAYFDNPISRLLDLVIKNIGYGAAKDLNLKINPPLLDHKERNIAELSLFKRGIDFFPPAREFRQTVGVSTSFFGKGSQRPLEYDLTVSYSDVLGNPVPPQVIRLDLSVYRDLPIHPESDIDRLGKEVKNLAEKLKALSP